MFPSWSPLKQQKNAMNRRTKLKNQHFSSWEEHTQEGRSQRGWPLNAYSNWRDWSHTQVTRTAPTAKGHTGLPEPTAPLTGPGGSYALVSETETLWVSSIFFFLATFGFLIHSVITLSVLQGQHKENTVFLRSNSHTIKFTNVKYIAQEFLVYSQSCGTITII